MILQIKGKKNYTLSIHHISLRLFDTNVGILTIELLNYDYPDVDDIFHINEFGRRIYPQFIGERNGIEETKNAFLADKIEFNFNGETIVEDFKSEDFLSKDLGIAKYISHLLGFLKDKIIPVIDDRMFTVCWYGNDALSQRLRMQTGNGYGYESSDTWYSLIFIDKSVGSGIANKEMLRELIKTATYQRWAEYGTLYGITRYSLICVTDTGEFGYNIIRNHMQRIYYQMAIILLAQRASILKFSNDVSKVSKKIGEIKVLKEAADEVKKIHSSFIHFINRLWFTEVTPQEQGIEMYSMALKTMGLTDQLNELRHEIKELYEFLEIEYEKEVNKKLHILNAIAVYLLPITIISGILGMSVFEPQEFRNVSQILFNFKWLYFFVPLPILIAIINICTKYLKKKL